MVKAPLIFPKVPESFLGILKVPQLPPPLEHPPLKNPTNASVMQKKREMFENEGLQSQNLLVSYLEIPNLYFLSIFVGRGPNLVSTPLLNGSSKMALNGMSWHEILMFKMFEVQKERFAASETGTFCRFRSP